MSSFSAVKETFEGERKDVNAPNDTTLPAGADTGFSVGRGATNFPKKMHEIEKFGIKRGGIKIQEKLQCYFKISKRVSCNGKS